MSKVLCLMKCNRIIEMEISGYNYETTKNNPTIGKEINLSPIAKGEFFKATPYGNVTLGLLNEEASKQFQVGKYYRVTFEEQPMGEEVMEGPKQATPL